MKFSYTIYKFVWYILARLTSLLNIYNNLRGLIYYIFEKRFRVFIFNNKYLLTNKDALKSLFYNLQNQDNFKNFGFKKIIIVSVIVDNREYYYHHNILIDNYTSFNEY